MIRFTFRNLLQILLITFSSFIYSQNNTNSKIPLNLNETWSKAIENSKKIQLSTLEYRINKEEVIESKLQRLPELEIKGNYEYATNIPVYEDGLFHKPTQHEVIHLLYKVSTGYYLNVYDGNKLNLKIDKKEILASIALEQQKMTTSEIKLQAAIYYLNLQRSTVFRDLMITDIANQEKQLAEIKSLFKNGVILRSDVLRVELKLSNQKMMLVKIENDIAIANQRLNILIGLPDEELINPHEILEPESFILEPYNQYLEIAKHNSYEYNISESKTELSKIELNNSKANVRPKIGLYGEFYLANPQIFLYPYSPSNYTLGIFGVKASFPLSELYLNKPKVRAAKLSLEKEELEHHDTDDKIRQQVFESYLRFKEGLVRIDVAKTDVDQSKENARIVNENYFNQASLITDLLDANVQLLQSQFDYASSKINAQINYYQLQNILGTL